MSFSLVIGCARRIASRVYREEKLSAEMHGLLSESRTNIHPHGWLQNHVGGLVVNQERKRGKGSEPAQTYGPPSRLPGRIGSGCLSRAGCWQVFGLASTSACAALLLSTASRLRRASACRGIVLADRCGAAPDSHRVPFLLSEKTQRTSTDGSLYNQSDVVKGVKPSGSFLKIRDAHTPRAYLRDSGVQEKTPSDEEIRHS